MIDTAPLERILRSTRRLQLMMLVLFGVNVFLATHAIVTPHALGVGWQALGVALNIVAGVYGWHVLKKNERFRAEVRHLIERAREFNRIFPS